MDVCTAVVPQRFAERAATRFTDTGDCWVSTYAPGSHGYAQVGGTEGGRHVVYLAHRAAWQFHNGTIPDGYTVDHRCHNGLCVNPAHLRLLTNLENARRTSGRDWPVTGRCLRGHDVTAWRPKTAERQKGYCSACRAEKRRAKKDAA